MASKFLLPLALSLTSVLGGCGDDASPTDGGADASPTDASPADASPGDAGLDRDAGAPDAGMPDPPEGPLSDLLPDLPPAGGAPLPEGGIGLFSRAELASVRGTFVRMTDVRDLDPDPDGSFLEATQTASFDHTVPGFSPTYHWLEAARTIDRRGEPEFGADELVHLAGGPGDGASTLRFRRGSDLTRLGSGPSDERLTFDEEAYDLAVGDIDGDGFDEVAVSFRNGEIAVFDDFEGFYAELARITTAGSPWSAVTMADLDRDGDDELLIGGVTSPGTASAAGRLWTYDWNGTTGTLDPAGNQPLETPTGFMEDLRGSPAIATGNFTGDHELELLFGASYRVGSFGSGTIMKFSVYEDLASSPTMVATAEPLGDLDNEIADDNGTSGDELHYWRDMPQTFEVGDIDRDGVDEVAWSWGDHEFLYDYDGGSFDPVRGPDPIFDPPLFHTESGGNFPTQTVFRMGDLDYDGDLDLLVAVSECESFDCPAVPTFPSFCDPDPPPPCDRVDYTAYAYEPVAREWVELYTYTRDLAGTTYTPLAMAIGDFDADGLTARPTGVVETLWGDPQVIAVLAAPPVVAGLASQNYDASSTGYGSGRGGSTSETNGTSLTSATTVSFEQEVSIPIISVKVAEFRASATFSASFSRSDTVTSSASESTTHFTGHLDDSVVYATTPYTRTQYEVVAAPDPSGVGKLFTIDEVVGTPETRKVTIPFYNRNNGDAPDIPADVFDHTPGDVRSYPTETRRDALQARYGASGFWRTSDATPVGMGNRFAERAIDLSTEMATVEEREIGIETSVGVSVAGPGLDQSVGLYELYSHEVTSNASTFYIGAVGDIQDEAEFLANQYSYGLMVYNYTADDDGNPVPAGGIASVGFQVVSYWVVAR